MHRPAVPDLRILLVFLLVLAPGVAAQSVCPAGRVTEVVIENQSIFDPAAISEESRLLWAYRLANAVHMRTREDFIAGEILLREGDCYDPRRVRESARLLREFRFIARADLSTELLDGGDRRLFVRTQDEWTTKFRLNLSLDDGVEFGGASLYEENLLGRGITLGFFWVNQEALNDVGGELEVPAIRGKGFDALLGVSRSRGGTSGYVTFVRPLFGEEEGTAFRLHGEHSGSLFSYVVPSGGEYSHLTVPDLVQRHEVTVARRFGVPEALYLFGGGLSYERVRGGAGGIEGVRNGDFSDREPVAGALATLVTEQRTSRRTLRLNLLLGVRRLAYETRGGLDAVNGVQDFPTGWMASLSLGRGVGGGGTGIPNDVFARLAGLSGWTTARTVGQVTLSTEGRRQDGGEADPMRSWKDLFVEGEGIVYLLPESSFVQNFVLRAAAHGGWRTTAPFQLTLGGPEGVRGYSDAAFPGGRRVIGSGEVRAGSPNPFPSFFDLGFTLFGDLGAVWAGDAPFGGDSGWRGSIGGGIRVGFPAGSSSVIRFDLAFPTGPGASDRKPILRISASDWVGLLGDPGSPQVNRSRRSGIRGEFVGAARAGGLR